MLEKLLNLYTSICSLNLLQILAIYGFVFSVLFSLYFAVLSVYAFKVTWNDIIASHGVERFAFCFLDALPILSALLFTFLCLDFFISHDKKVLFIYALFGLAVLLDKIRYLIKYYKPLSIITYIAKTILDITELKLLTQEDIKSATTETVVSFVQLIDELNEEKKDSIAKEMDLGKEETEVAK